MFENSRNAVFFILLVSYNVLSTAQQANPVVEQPSPEFQAIIQKRVNIHRGWGSKMNSPGARLSIKETARADGCIRYELYAEGLPKDIAYEFIIAPMTATDSGDAQSYGNVHIESDGLVVDSPGDPRVVIVPQPASGEPLRIGLISADFKQRAAVSVMPNPIEATDNGCRISIVRLSPQFEIALAQGFGFPPGKEVLFEGSSHGETHSGKLRANQEGYVDTVLLPFVKDKLFGDTVVRFTAKKCKPSTTFTWGTLR